MSLEPHGQRVGGKSLIPQPIRFERSRYAFLIPWCERILSFFLIASKVSEARLRLTQGEAAEVEREGEAPHKVSASVFVRMGLELEDQQYVSALQQ